MRGKRLFYTAIFFIATFFLFYYIFTGTSYEKSLQAKLYYTMGKYKEAFEISKEVSKEDPYNKMAMSVAYKSKLALDCLKYINEAKGYLKKIETISSKKSIAKKELLKIKLICEVAIGEYERLRLAPLDNDKLKNEAKGLYKQFRKIYNELFK